MGGRGIGRSFSGAAIAAAAFALLAPASGAANVLSAESVMPPGQSGFVSIAGVTSGTGSPHLTDQIGLFNSFSYKDAQLGQAGQEETPRPGVRIVRDGYGVPAVYGDSSYDTWWGAGYAAAQDRLFELELFRRAASGRLAEILGSTYMHDDLIARRDYYTDGEVDQMVARFSPYELGRFAAYRDGVNAWIDHVQSNPADMPGEFVALGDLPIAPWTIRDSARVGILLARTVPNGDGAELDNARALAAIGPANFNRLLPLHPPGTQFTVPRTAGSFPSLPGRTRKQERQAFQRSITYLHGVPLPAASGSAGLSRKGNSLDALVRGIGGSSFMYAFQDRRHHRAFLYNGPQLGFAIPELLVELEVHEPGHAPVRGVTAAGVPLIGIGHNDHVAWGLTSGESDTNDLYAEKLAGPESYVFKGETRQMDCRDETFSWRAPPTDLPGLVPNPGQPAGSKTERICRTIHGPVQAQAGGWAFARRYNTWGRELETLHALIGINDAASVKDVARAIPGATWNENVMAIDDRGNLGYWHPGLLPRRSKRWDERLPMPGQGQAEWRGFLDRARQDPHVINPRRGWLANWNNFPSAGWTSGDSESRGRLTGVYHRVHLLEALVAKAARHPSYDGLKDVVKVSGTTTQARPFLDPRKLAKAIRASSGTARQALIAVRGWDGSYVRVDSSDRVDPGVAIFEELKHQLELRLIGPLGAGAALLSPPPSDFHFFDTTNGEAAALRRLGPAGYAAAASATAAALSQRFGTTDVSAWREPRHLYPVTAQGAGSSPDLPFFDRGTWNQAVALGP